ncbi:hypothetical protein ACFWN5_05615 [Streptomyces sp. NPDC058430]|uniref:hypothetical protein n=1 Tax=Streptomyces sp. NPDC058430 TaxID=3346495 RepID=UPI00364DD36C
MKTASKPSVKYPALSRIRYRMPAVCVVQAHQQVAGLLGVPLGGDIAGDAGNAHATGAVLDEEQDEKMPQENRIHVEDIDGKDPFGLGRQELGPGAVGAPGRRVDVGPLQDLPDGGDGDLPSQVDQFARDPAISPSVVLAGQAQYQSTQCLGFGRAARASVRIGPLLRDQPRGPAQHGTRGDQQLQR